MRSIQLETAKALYKCAYRLQRMRDQNELDRLSEFLDTAELFGLIEYPNRQRNIIEAAMTSFDNRNVCDTYEHWTANERLLLAQRRLLKPIGDIFLQAFVELTNAAALREQLKKEGY